MEICSSLFCASRSLLRAKAKARLPWQARLAERDSVNRNRSASPRRAQVDNFVGNKIGRTLVRPQGGRQGWRPSSQGSNRHVRHQITKRP